VFGVVWYSPAEIGEQGLQMLRGHVKMETRQQADQALPKPDQEFRFVGFLL
jgi:hypothetical protein